VDKGALVREFFDRILRCPHCHSVNLRPSNCCPKCGSRNLARGRVLEHISCRFVGLEDDFVSGDSYICPKCGSELRISGGDYQSLGLMNKCQDCYEIFAQPEIQWRCLKCRALTPQDSINEVNVYSYRFNEARREWLEFEVKPKSQLIEFLRNLGYEVAEDAVVKGRSGAEHKIDILATKDDGIVVHDIAIGVEVGKEPIGLEKLFAFDNKAYDIGILDKVFIAVPSLAKESRQFAQRQRIKVFEAAELEPSR
jgi:RNA polymerase subunit RPABC4/transcription elongation factor Spt4